VSLWQLLNEGLRIPRGSFFSPPHVVVFSVAVLRHSETEGTRVVGYVEIERDKVLGSVELNRCSRCSLLSTLNIIAENYNVAFELKLNNVNPDGPSLKFNAGFSVSESPYSGVYGLACVGMLDNKCKTAQKLSDH
jgi:hypothetical protein